MYPDRILLWVPVLRPTSEGTQIARCIWVRFRRDRDVAALNVYAYRFRPAPNIQRAALVITTTEYTGDGTTVHVQGVAQIMRPAGSSWRNLLFVPYPGRSDRVWVFLDSAAPLG